MDWVQALIALALYSGIFVLPYPYYCCHNYFKVVHCYKAYPTMVSPIVAIKNGIKYCRTCDIKGRSPRSEFWWFTLFTIFSSFLILFLLITVGDELFRPASDYPEVEITITILAVTIVLIYIYCNFVIDARRFHDTNTSVGLLIFLKVFIIALLVSKESIVSLGPSFDARLAIQGAISVIVFAVWLGLLAIYCSKGTQGPNRYGPDPLAKNSEVVSDSNSSDTAQQN